jgi:hypothetical protein
VNVIDRPIATQEGSPFGVNHPGDFGCWISVAQEGGGGQSMNNIA